MQKIWLGENCEQLVKERQSAMMKMFKDTTDTEKKITRKYLDRRKY